MKYNVGDIFLSNFVTDYSIVHILTLTDEYYGWDKEKRYKLQLLTSTNTKSIMVIYTKEDIEFMIEKGKLTHYPVKKDNI